MRLDINHIRQQIANLKIACPEAWEDGDEQLLHDMLEGETDLDDFLTVVESRRQDAEAMAAAVAARIAQLSIRQERFEQREVGMRKIAFSILEAANLLKRELAIATLSIRAGSQKVILTDEALIPDILCELKRIPKKDAIKKMLKEGKEVRGAELSNAQPCLSVRVK